MATVLDIFNQALGHIGNKAITDRTESSVCELYYPTARDSCLSWALWTFATVRQKLVRLDDSTMVTSDFAHQYLLPTNPAVLRTINIDLVGSSTGVLVGDQTLSNPLAFKREIYIDPLTPDTQQPVLLTNADEVVLKYLAQISEGAFPPLFTVCVSLWLATDISQTLSRKASLRTELFAELQVKLSRLMDIDGHQDSPRQMEFDTRYVNGRDRQGSVAPFTGGGTGL